jgi:hypothetical protein
MELLGSIFSLRNLHLTILGLENFVDKLHGEGSCFSSPIPDGCASCTDIFSTSSIFPDQHGSLNHLLLFFFGLYACLNQKYCQGLA